MILKNYLAKNEIKYCLIGKIKGLAEESKRTNQFIKKKKFKPENAWVLVRRKDAISSSTRYHLLAYAFLSGKRYSSLEAKCQDEKKPNVSTIYKIVANHLSAYTLEYNSINESKITEWLES